MPNDQRDLMRRTLFHSCLIEIDYVLWLDKIDCVPLESCETITDAEACVR
jgi:hypothetical protein